MKHPVRWTRTIETEYLKFQCSWRKKVKSETFECLATEYGSLKSIALIFMIGCLASDGEKGRRIALSHDSRG